MILALLTGGKDTCCNLCMYEFHVKWLEFKCMLCGIELLCWVPAMLLAGSDCRGCDYARDNNIPILAYPKGKNAPEGITPSELVQSLR